MELTDKQIQIMDGKICPYCGSPSIFVDSKEIYGKSYGMIYLCRKCDAYVGVHEGSMKAKGRLANKQLRQWKKEAHRYFDLIWRSGADSRGEAYAWLSGKLKLPPKYTHIGMFNVDTCREVARVSKQYLNDMRRLDLDMGTEPKTEHLS